MRCSNVLSNLGYECQQLSDDVSKLITPFTLADDGELITVTIVELGKGRVKLTDAGATLFHMSSMGVKLTSKRLNAITGFINIEGCELTKNGEIAYVCEASDVPISIASITKAIMMASTLQMSWTGVTRRDRFRESVDVFLRSRFDNIKTDVTLIGLSGHQLELPFSIKNQNNVVYIQTIGRKSDKLNWDSVYRTHGKMAEIRELPGSRVVVIDDMDNQECEQARLLLHDVASIAPFSMREEWVSRLTA